MTETCQIRRKPPIGPVTLKMYLIRTDPNPKYIFKNLKKKQIFDPIGSQMFRSGKDPKRSEARSEDPKKMKISNFYIGFLYCLKSNQCRDYHSDKSLIILNNFPSHKKVVESFHLDLGTRTEQTYPLCYILCIIYDRKPGLNRRRR